MPEAVKITQGGLKTLLGIDPTSNTNPQHSPSDVSFVNRYSPSELKSQLRRLYVRPEDSSRTAHATPAGIISYLKPVSDQVGAAKVEAKRLRKIAPEINQARTLVASSILSPNDLQDGEFTFNFENVPALEDNSELLRKVAEYYSDYFNGVLKLGVKSFDWIGEALYESGAKCLLTLPLATQIDLRHRDYRTVSKIKTNLEAGFASDTYDSINKILDDNQDYVFSNYNKSFAEFCGDDISNTSVKELIPQMESYGVEIPVDYLSAAERNAIGKGIGNYMNTHGSDYVAGMERMIVNLRTKLKEGDLIRISENTQCCRFVADSKQRIEDDLWSRLNDQYGLNLNKRPALEDVAILNANPDGIPHQGHPSVIELPTEAVIPIFVPGSPSEHLGYFIILDNHGQPISVTEEAVRRKANNSAAGFSTAKAYDTMFGSNCCNATFHSNINQYTQMGSLIFNELLDAYIRTRMKGIYHDDDLEIGRFNALAAMLFQRTLDAKETMLVFVPPMLLTYMAFDYYDDTGVGKSVLADIQFALSLRTTLMMANVVAAVSDAIEHKKIEFGVDDKNVNLEAVMRLIGNIFIEKNKLNGAIEPAEIMKDMYSNSLTVVPKNIPGLSDMSVEVSNSGGSSTRVDDQTLENLNNLIYAQLGAPASALNQMSEVEYARSIVVSNLFFAKDITRKQRHYCSHMDKFVRNYVKVDPKFQKGLVQICNTYTAKQVKDPAPEEVNKLAANNPNQESPLADLPRLIMENVTTSLPKPNIVVDKAQFEEINNYMNNLQTLADKFFSQEMISSDDVLAQTALPIVKAKWMSDQLSKFITEVGSFKMCDVPDLSEFSINDLIKDLRPYANIGAAIKQHVAAMAKRVDDMENGEDTDFGGGFEDAGMGGEFGEEGGNMGMNEGGGETSDFEAMGGTGGEQASNIPGEGKDNNATMSSTLASQYLKNLKH